ncbi:hypothetical protein FNV43_RR15061 [Rhamnella rubrinervis]|uniref:Uncharacterized protein n=1 Tax=Rhamnella rubrinervis TaxID=2594499 RepID=A0A8K0E891_9ROSA|nr:hypothetical protein FNV43_RR15061 [Rhamnella rubrinervis]
MVLNYFNIAPRQLISNGWRYLLGLIVLSKRCGRLIDMPTFLHFFYPKSSEEGIYAFYPRRQIRLLDDAPTSDKGWKERYFFINREGLFDPVGTSDSGIHFAYVEKVGYWPSEQGDHETNPQHPQAEPIPEGIPLLILEVPYTHILEGCISKVKGKAPQTPKACLRLEDSASVCSELDQMMEVMDSLMTRHDRVIFKGMMFEDISHEAEQCALKDCRHLSKVDNAWKNATALNNLAATNKKLEEEVQHLKQIAADTISKTEQLEKN